MNSMATISVLGLTELFFEEGIGEWDKDGVGF